MDVRSALASSAIQTLRPSSAFVDTVNDEGRCSCRPCSLNLRPSPSCSGLKTAGNRPPGTGGYWQVLSLQLTSDRSSSQCAPVGPSSARWNDKWNDMPATQPSSVGGLGRAAEPMLWGRRAPWHHRAERQQPHRPYSAAPKGPDQRVKRAGPRPPPPITPAPLLCERGGNYPRPRSQHWVIYRCHTAGQPLASSQRQ
jgi:hypothetical protein